MDTTRHLAEDADKVRVSIGNGGIDDAVSVTVIVTLEDSGVANGRPIALHDIRDIDLSLLLEIEPARVAAIVDIVGKVYQIVAFNDEGIALYSSTMREKGSIVLPYTI